MSKMVYYRENTDSYTLSDDLDMRGLKWILKEYNVCSSDLKECELETILNLMNKTIVKDSIEYKINYGYNRTKVIMFYEKHNKRLLYDSMEFTKFIAEKLEGISEELLNKLRILLMKKTVGEYEEYIMDIDYEGNEITLNVLLRELKIHDKLNRYEIDAISNALVKGEDFYDDDKITYDGCFYVSKGYGDYEYEVVGCPVYETHICEIDNCIYIDYIVTGDDGEELIDEWTFLKRLTFDMFIKEEIEFLEKSVYKSTNDVAIRRYKYELEMLRNVLEIYYKETKKQKQLSKIEKELA